MFAEWSISFLVPLSKSTASKWSLAPIDYIKRQCSLHYLMVNYVSRKALVEVIRCYPVYRR